MKPVNSLSQKPLILGLAAMAFFAAAGTASAVVIAGYSFSSGSITNANTFTATAMNTAAAQPGVIASNFNPIGGDSGNTTSVSISGGTNTAYIQASYTPAAANIFTATKYFTFNVSLTSAYNLGTLTFQYGGTNVSPATANIVYGAQIQIGGGSFTNLTTASAAIPIGTANYASFGTYSADLSAYQNINDTVTIRIFAADDSNDNGAVARIKNVELNASAIPEPATAASLAAALGAFALRRRRA
jgi:hypothetical protein